MDLLNDLVSHLSKEEREKIFYSNAIKQTKKQPHDLNLKSLTKKQFVDSTAFLPSFYISKGNSPFARFWHKKQWTWLFLCLFSHFPKWIYKARPQATCVHQNWFSTAINNAVYKYNQLCDNTNPWTWESISPDLIRDLFTDPFAPRDIPHLQ